MPDPAKNHFAGLTEHTRIIPLDFLALIEVTGEDAQEFLQGQLSNDLDAIGAGEKSCQLNAYCNPKGRVLALIRLVKCAAGFQMIVPAELADNLVRRLTMYVLRAKVKIARKPEIPLLGRIGPPDSDDRGNGIQPIPLAGALPRQILLGAAAAEAWRDAGEVAVEANGDAWRLADILSGIPQVYAQTVEAFIPQMINLDLVDGLSFTKGCYPGQEIVARLRYLGKVKQRMLVGTVGGAVAEVGSLAPGDPIHDAQRGDQKVGMVVDAVKTGDDHYTFSTTAPPALIEHGELRVGSATGAPLTRIPLPYPAPTGQSA